MDADESEALHAIGWTQAESKCPDSSLLLAADEGALDDSLADGLRAHVRDCPTCQQLAKDLVLVIADAPTGGETARISRRIEAGRSSRRAAPYLWLGGLAAAAAIAWFFFTPRTSLAPVPDSQIARATPAPAPTVFGIDRPAIPPGEIDLTVRGEATTPVNADNEAALALDRADSGDVKAAIADLEALARKNPQSRRAVLALGALLLRDARDAEALTILERARLLKSAPGMDDEVDWYLAIARIRAGDRAGARILLEAVCRRTGARSARGCAGVAEIDRLPSGR